MSGAKLDAEAAALAALDGDVDGTFGHSGEGVHADGHTELGSDAMPCSARAAQPCVADAGKRNFSASVRMCRLNREQRVSFGMAAAVGIISPQPDLTNTPDLSDTDSAWVNRTEMIGSNFNPKPEVSKMRSVCIITVAVVLLGLGPLLAANNASLISVPHPPNVPSAVPGTVNEGFLATSVLATITDPQGILPCFDCVSGPDVQTLLIALPLAAVIEGHAVTIIVTGDDLFYGGTAAFTFNIRANPTVAPILTETVSGTVSPGIWLAQFPITVPAPGQYILQGEISTGENLHQHTQVSASLLIGAN